MVLSLIYCFTLKNVKGGGMVQNKHGIVVKKKPQVKKTFNVGNV